MRPGASPPCACMSHTRALLTCVTCKWLRLTAVACCAPGHHALGYVDRRPQSKVCQQHGLPPCPRCTLMQPGGPAQLRPRAPQGGDPWQSPGQKTSADHRRHAPATTTAVAAPTNPRALHRSPHLRPHHQHQRDGGPEVPTPLPHRPPDRTGGWWMSKSKAFIPHIQPSCLAMAQGQFH